MNKVVLMGRLTRDPNVRYSAGDNPVAIARYTLAVNRKSKNNGETAADFIPCLALGKNGEFAEKYLRQGMRVAISGRIQTGSYTNNEGTKIYTVEVLTEEQEFAESKKDNTAAVNTPPAYVPPTSANDGFMNIPEGLGEEVPFN